MFNTYIKIDQDKLIINDSVNRIFLSINISEIKEVLITRALSTSTTEFICTNDHLLTLKDGQSIELGSFGIFQTKNLSDFGHSHNIPVLFRTENPQFCPLE